MKTMHFLSWLASGLAFLSGFPVAVAGPSLTLATPPAEKPAPLGPLHLAGPGPHVIPLAIRGVPGTALSLKGELFRLLATTAAPLGSFVGQGESVIPASGELLFQPELSFPETTAPVSYLARFGQPDFPSLAIIVHPANFLAPLQTLSQGQPLQLVDAPGKLPALLREAGIRTTAAVQSDEHSIILCFSGQGPLPEAPKQGRLILCDLTDPGREVWKRSASGGWTIHLHPAALDPARLATTAGLNHLLELTTSEPLP